MLIRKLILLLLLMACWVAFSGYLESKFIIMGVASCLLVSYFVGKMKILEGDKYPLATIIRLPFYLLWLVKEITKASVDVSLRIWHVEPEISPVLAWVDAHQKNDVSKVIYANSITLTPGTVCTDVKGDMLEVHALSKSTLAGLRKGDMDKMVKRTAG